MNIAKKLLPLLVIVVAQVAFLTLGSFVANKQVFGYGGGSSDTTTDTTDTTVVDEPLTSETPVDTTTETPAVTPAETPAAVEKTTPKASYVWVAYVAGAVVVLGAGVYFFSKRNA